MNMRNLGSVVATAALVWGIGSAASFAADVDGASTLGQSIAASAARAEQTASTAAAVQPLVRASVQDTIIAAGAEPTLVLAAIDSAVAACRPATVEGWTCPTSNEAFAALLSIRGIVLAQADGLEPAAFDTPGTAAFATVPASAPGGAGYRAF